jgi:ABC-type Zn uptake system ZnuABC Zn-binding protein ZnuA
MNSTEEFFLDIKRGCRVVTNVIDALIKSAKENEVEYQKEQQQKVGTLDNHNPKSQFTVIKNNKEGEI